MWILIWDPFEDGYQGSSIHVLISIIVTKTVGF